MENFPESAENQRFCVNSRKKKVQMNEVLEQGNSLLKTSLSNPNIDCSFESAVSMQSDTAIDADLYSRQIGTYGMETMGKLVKLRILIYGLSGVGVEIAKNVILAGVKEVTLVDSTPAKFEDLSSNFFLTEMDVISQRTRADSVLGPLARLNDYVKVGVKNQFSMEMLEFYDVVVVTGQAWDTMVKINHECRKYVPSKGFIAADTLGIMCYCFVDFGDSFKIFDPDGNKTKSAIVEAISQEGNEGIVYIHEDKRMPFSSGDYVVFREVEGMVELNNTAPRLIKVTGKHSFSIGDIGNFSAYVSGGVAEQVKMPISVQFLSLQKSAELPLPPGIDSLIEPDLSFPGRSAELLWTLLAFYKFVCTSEKNFPKENLIERIAECVRKAKSLNDSARRHIEENTSRGCSLSFPRTVNAEKIDEDFIELFVSTSGLELSPLTSFVGGIAAQEVVKYTGKYTPIRQWFLYDARQLLNNISLSKEIRCQNSIPEKYRVQSEFWGTSLQASLGGLKIFLIGAGALGSEYIKCLAMMGCCIKQLGGCLYITDMDRIEVSNLNRQFLFQKEHVGMSKSKVAGGMACKMNSDIAVQTFETRVGPETENVFNEKFWKNIDIVINALDNINSRIYVDGKCVWYKKPLLEAGTLGTQGNVQIIVPKLTQCYSDSRDPPEESIPLCTLKHFPNEIEHTIEWARVFFETLFLESPSELRKFLEAPDNYLNECDSTNLSQTVKIESKFFLSVLRLFVELLESKGNISEILVTTAVNLFNELFNFAILDLLHAFPVDHLTAEGTPFWSGPKRCPTNIRFDPCDTLHMQFVVSAAKLYASVFLLPLPNDATLVESIAMELAPKLNSETRAIASSTLTKITIQGLESNGSDAAEQPGSAGSYALYRSEISRLANSYRDLLEKAMVDINPIEFEKDGDPTHIDFIHSAANMRARNYKIPEAQRDSVKIIAGKITPAIATTTAVVTGFASLEMIKIVSNTSRPIEDYRNAFLNLALPVFIMSEPLPPILTNSVDYDPIVQGQVRAIPEGFSCWDTIDIHIPNNKVKDIIEFLKTQYGFEINFITMENLCVYCAYNMSHKERLGQSIQTICKNLSNRWNDPEREYLPIEVSGFDENCVDVYFPVIRLKITD